MMRIGHRLIELPLVSAINGQASKMDRSGELRSKPETLEKLWSSAKILHFADGRLAGDSALTFLTATEVDERFLLVSLLQGRSTFLVLIQKTIKVTLHGTLSGKLQKQMTKRRLASHLFEK